MVHLLESSRAALAALALVVGGLFLTLDRVPLLWSDDALYASVARSVQQHGDGRPSMLRRVPETPDHVTFYGPVFFRLAAWSFAVSGFTLKSLRAVSLLGALVMAGAAYSLAATFGLSFPRRVWSAVLLLLAPSVGASATNGRMDTLAVGLSMAGLAVLVSAVARPERRTAARGAGAGVLLLLSALTTPRGLPLVGACLLGTVGLVAVTQLDRALGRVALAAAVVLAAGILGWGQLAHGDPLGWFQTLRATVPHVAKEVAFAEGATRDWQLPERPWVLVPLVAALPLTIAGAYGLGARRLNLPPPLLHAAWLAVTVVWLNLAVALAVTNRTFAFDPYFTAPLLAVALALPHAWLPLRSSTMALLVGALLLVLTGGRVLKYATAAATWDARDPAPLRAFVASHVPAGAQVIGRTRFYLFAVEGSGSEMVSLSGESVATWPRYARRWSGRIDPAPGARRFLLMSVDGNEPALPDGSSCAGARLVAEYQPPGDTIPVLGALARRIGDTGYPRSALWELPSQCEHEPGRIIDRTQVTHAMPDSLERS